MDLNPNLVSTIHKTLDYLAYQRINLLYLQIRSYNHINIINLCKRIYEKVYKQNVSDICGTNYHIDYASQLLN